MENVIAILEEVIAGVDFTVQKELVTDGYIDSFDIVTIIDRLEEEFGINIPVENMVPENFESADAMYTLITLIKDGEV